MAAIQKSSENGIRLLINLHHSVNIPLYAILTILTGGIFGIYWQYRKMDACKAMYPKEDFDFKRWLVGTVCTLGLYHVFYQYYLAQAIDRYQREHQLGPVKELSVTSPVLTGIFLGVIADVLLQTQINKIVRGKTQAVFLLIPIPGRVPLFPQALNQVRHNDQIM